MPPRLVRGVRVMGAEGGAPQEDTKDPILGAVREAFAAEPRPRPTPPGPERRAPSPPPPTPGPSDALARRAVFGIDPNARRAALVGLLAAGLGPGDVEVLGRALLTDPDPELRALAAKGLADARSPLPRGLIERSLLDPVDGVRAAAVELAAREGRAGIDLLIPLIVERSWSLAQRSALQRLPDVIRRAGGLTERELDQLLALIAGLDPPPLAVERQGYGELARAVGTDRLILELDGTEERRRGATRLLLCDASPSSLEAISRVAPEGRAGAAATASAGAAAELHDVVAALSGALEDPDPMVRLQAEGALRSLPREELVRWTNRSIREPGLSSAGAAAVAQALRLHEASAAVLEVAAALPDDERAPYLRALAEMHPKAESLAALVSTTDHSVRAGAVRVSWQVGGRAILPFLVSLLEDSAGAVRLAVLEAFADSGDPGAERLATELLRDDSSAAVRAFAVHVLARLPGDAAGRALSQALSDPDPDVRATAVEGLAEGWWSSTHIQSPVTLLLAALHDEDDRVARAATARVATLPESELPAIWSAIHSAGPRVRADLVRAIEVFDPARLARLAGSNAQAPDPADRALAVDLAARAAVPESTRIVVEALSDPDPVVRRTAASAMSAIRAPAAVQALARSLSDPQADVRVEAVRALGLIDDDAVPSILIEAMKDPEVMVRTTAADALLRWRSPAVARRLASALGQADLRRPASDVLEKMGPAAVPPLVEVVTGSDPIAAAVAGGLLARISGPDRFVETLRSTDPEERLRAVEVVGAIGGRTASDALVASLTDPDVRVRVRSATLLGSLGDPRSVRSLRRVFLSDPVMEVAAAAEAALRALGDHPEADPSDFGPWVADE